MSDVFIVGCGYVGRRLARRIVAQGDRVSALVNSRTSAEQVRPMGVPVVIGDLDAPSSIPELPLHGMELYYFAPPPPHGTHDIRLAAFLDRLHGSNLPKRVVLISTTGVYGDCRGEWIDETRPVAPRADRARRRVDAENQMQAWGQATGVPAVILRVAGIYGPGKLPIARISAAEPVLREAESPFSNRVHVDDLVETCIAAMQRGRAGSVYNVADGHPSTMTDYFNRVADAMSLPRPPSVGLAQAQAQMSAGMLSYLAESKRIDISRLRDELCVTLRYPDLTSGIAAVVAEERTGTAV